MVNRQISLGLIVLASQVMFIIMSVVGWFMNIVKLVHMTGHDGVGFIVVRAIGVLVPPIGAFVGWMS